MKEKPFLHERKRLHSEKEKRRGERKGTIVLKEREREREREREERKRERNLSINDINNSATTTKDGLRIKGGIEHIQLSREIPDVKLNKRVVGDI